MVPLIYFLIAWGVFILIFGIMAMLAILQMMRFGIAGLGTYASTFLFMAISVVTILGCVVYFLTVDWSQGVNIFGGLMNSPFFNPSPT
jgi:hypothetical protein